MIGAELAFRVVSATLSGIPTYSVEGKSKKTVILKHPLLYRSVLIHLHFVGNAVFLPGLQHLGELPIGVFIQVGEEGVALGAEAVLRPRDKRQSGPKSLPSRPSLPGSR